MPATFAAPLNDLWLAETVRLREEHWGPLEDAQAVRLARQADAPLPARVLMRAHGLAQREGLDEKMHQWRRASAVILALLLGLALLAGIGAAAGSLGDGSRTVNIVWALGALLGLHALTFVLWLLSFAVAPRTAGAGLARVWLWASRAIAKGPDAGLPPRALLGLLARAGALRWLFGAISHLIWLVALGAALATLVAILSTASYRFAWATTLLTPETFVRLTALLGWLPAHLGFPVPDAAMVRASDGIQTLPAAAQVQWSLWLIGAVAVYGILPRLLAWIVSVVLLRRAVAALRIDMALPGYAGLRERLAPAAESLGVERAAQPLHQPHVGYATAADSAEGRQPPAVLVGLELPDDIPWPPADVPADVYSGGNLDTREQRNGLLDALASAPAPRLLIACDARQTPDRGTVSLIADLSSKALQTRVWLIQPPAATGGDAQDPRRIHTWHAQLQAAGMSADAVLRDAGRALHWLEDAHG
jgi:hypothetical protein